MTHRTRGHKPPRHRWWMDCRMLGFNHQVAEVTGNHNSHDDTFVCISCHRSWR